MQAQPGQGMLSLIDHREVSPAPVSHFAPRTLGGASGNIGSTRVTLPFRRGPKRQGSVFNSLSLKRASTENWQENFKFSSQTKES